MPHPGGSSLPPPAQRAVDLLDLLSGILDKQILARLPAGDVVCTSVLSRPWRRRWESVEGLDIELPGFRHDHDAGACSWESAARLLDRCASPVGRVSIRNVPLCALHRADEWVRAVAGKRRRALALRLPAEAVALAPEYPEEAVVLPSLFLCDAAALAELELRCCAIPAPPAGFAGFQRLGKLDLDDVVFTGDNAWPLLEAMISAAAPTLVELRLQNVEFLAADQLGRWVIGAPNLRKLVLCLNSYAAGIWELAGPLPKLELSRIFLNDSGEEIDYVQMFTAISSVSELQLGNFRAEPQAPTINIFLDLLRRFENLRIVRLDGCFYESPTNQLLRLSPSIETVEIKGWY